MVITEVPLDRVTLKNVCPFHLVDGYFHLIWILFFGRLVAVYMQKRQSKGTKRKTRQAKALENARKAPRTFLELLNEVITEILLNLYFYFKLLLWYLFDWQLQANLEPLPPHVPSYLKAAVGPPSSISRRHFCTVCGCAARYTCVKCGTRFCSCRCQNIHNDTRCLKFVA